MRLIALAGNPNVGKSTLFNALTGLRQHTGNWAGKTVSLAQGHFAHKGEVYRVADLPGTYSLQGKSPEEKVAEEFLRSSEIACTVVVCDATCLERSLILALQVLQKSKNAVICVNLIDEAKRKGIAIDLPRLQKELGVPVVATSAAKKDGLDALQETLRSVCDGFEPMQPLKLENAEPKDFVSAAQEIAEHTVKQKARSEALDKIFLHRIFGKIAMLLLLFAVLFLTVWGANVPSELLQKGFEQFGELLEQLPMPRALSGLLLGGVYATASRVVAVMLPPMAIFFPLFTLLEDFGYLPRVAYLLDGQFEKAGACGKQSLTMCMGLGCNAVGVYGCRIIDSPRERKIALLTNAFVPCNGKFPILLALLSASCLSPLWTAMGLMLCILISVFMTFFASKILSKTIFRGEKSAFVLELPPYRKPRVFQVLLRAAIDRIGSILWRAVAVAAPAGAILWLLCDVNVGGQPLLNVCAELLDPVGCFFGLSGAILLAFILGSPANELVLPILALMVPNSAWQTSACMIAFTLFHWPCLTTLWSIYRESRSAKETALAALLPTLFGLAICLLITALAGR